MVDIVIISDAVLKMHIVIDRSKYIFPGNMLRDKLVDTSANCLLQLFLGSAAVQNLAEYRVVNQFGHTQFLLLFLAHFDPAVDVNHEGRENFRARDLFLALYVLVMGKYRDGRNSFILYPVRDFSRTDRSGFRNHFTALGVDDILSQSKSADPVAETELFVVLVPADFRQVISPRIKKEILHLKDSGIDRQRFSGTDFFIQLEEALIIIGRLIFRERSLDLGLIAEKLDYLLIGSDSESTDQNGNRHFPGSVDTNIKDVVGIRLILQPRTPVGNDRACIELFAVLIVTDSVINPGGTD